jgi:hypothetical protein
MVFCIKTALFEIFDKQSFGDGMMIKWSKCSEMNMGEFYDDFVRVCKRVQL